MKTKQLFKLIPALLLATSLAASAWAKPPKMKMTTPVPPGIATPDRLETRIGTLESYSTEYPTRKPLRKSMTTWTSSEAYRPI